MPSAFVCIFACFNMSSASLRTWRIAAFALVASAYAFLFTSRGSPMSLCFLLDFFAFAIAALLNWYFVCCLFFFFFGATFAFFGVPFALRFIFCFGLAFVLCAAWCAFVFFGAG